MSRFKRGGFVFVTWVGDHPPRHVHVFRKERLIVKYDLVRQKVIEGKMTRKILRHIAALQETGPEVAEMKRIYNERRKFMIKRLKELGFSITVEPTGAFYVFANARSFSGDSYRLAFDILEKAHVGVTPGIDFGENGEGYLRFSYANSIENIAEGLNRIENYLGNL